MNVPREDKLLPSVASKRPRFLFEVLEKPELHLPTVFISLSAGTSS